MNGWQTKLTSKSFLTVILNINGYINYLCLKILPSPNMPSLDTAIVYPGFGLFEGTDLSEGRGTT